jgi:hypothetical protein
VLDKFELLPNALGAREITSPRAGFVTAIDAEDIGRASAMIGADAARRTTSRSGCRRHPGSEGRTASGRRGVLARLYYTKEDGLDEAAGLIEDAFHISSSASEERALILEVVARSSPMQRFTGLLGLVAILLAAFLVSKHKRAIKLSLLAWGLGLQFASRSWC